MHAMGGGLKKRVVCTTSSFHFVEIEKVYEIYLCVLVFRLIFVKCTYRNVQLVHTGLQSTQYKN